MLVRDRYKTQLREMTMNIVFSCPSSHPAPRWAAHGLRSRGHSIQFFTSLAVPGDRNPDEFAVPERVRAELRRRRLPLALSRDIVHNSAPFLECFRVLAERLQRTEVNVHLQHRVNEAVQKKAIRFIETHGKPDAIFATGSISHIISQYAYEQDIPLALYLPQPVMRFVDTFAPEQSEAMRAHEKIGAAELMASSVFLASSRLVEESILHEGLGRPIIRHPLGFPKISTSNHEIVARKRCDPDDHFKLLYVGRVSPQKDIPTLLAAVKKLALTNKIDLTVVTRDTADMLDLVQKNGVGHLVDVRPSMGRDALFNLMREHHCFVLPSIFEGYGLVIVEALANGLPVITTPYTAGGDLGIDGHAGSIVPSSQPYQLATAIRTLIQDPALASHYSKAAEELTLELSWDHYAKSVSERLEVALRYISQ